MEKRAHISKLLEEWSRIKSQRDVKKAKKDVIKKWWEFANKDNDIFDAREPQEALKKVLAENVLNPVPKEEL